MTTISERATQTGRRFDFGTLLNRLGTRGIFLVLVVVRGRAKRRTARRSDAPPGRPSQARGGWSVDEAVSASGAFTGGPSEKNTIDLQWKIDANYNAKP